MIPGLIHITPVTQKELPILARLAVEDNHGIYCPTHLMKQGEEIVGYFSVGSPGVPIIMCWFDTKRMKSRESFHAINTVEEACRMNGAAGVSFPVPKNSPFHSLMEGMGFKNNGNYDFFTKSF